MRLNGPWLLLARRLAGMLVTVLGLAVTVFILVKLIPGDEARVAAGAGATPAQVAAAREQLGLDHSLVVQFATFLEGLLHGDLGSSIITHQPVAGEVMAVLPHTVELVVFALVMMVIAVVPLATISALRREGALDVSVRTSVLFTAGLPTFWLALLTQYLFGSKWAMFPISGVLSRGVSVTPRTGSVLIDALLGRDMAAFFDTLDHLFLPAVVLALPFGAQLYRVLRADLIQVFGREYLSVVRSKGVGEFRLVALHAMPNALGPALTVLGVLFGTMVGGAVLVESVFGLPGIGSYLMNAVAQKDSFAVLGGTLVIGLLVIVTNFVVDMIQLVRDPRLRSVELGG